MRGEGEAMDLTALSGRIENGVHQLWQRVYYEDTDTAGIVYHANYLRFAERARTEILRLMDISQTQMRAQTGAVFAVRRCEIDYRRPARLDDLLEIRTWVSGISRARVTMVQAIRRASDGMALADLTIEVVCLDGQGRPVRLPDVLSRAMDGLYHPGLEKGDKG